MHAAIILLVPLQALSRPQALERERFLDHTSLSGPCLYHALEYTSSLVGHFLQGSKDDQHDFIDCINHTVPPQPKRKLDAFQSDVPAPHPKRQQILSTNSNNRPEATETSQSEPQSQDVTKNDEKPRDKCPQQDEVSRNRLERDRCCLRDEYKCIFTNTSPAQAAHIIPFACNKNEDSRNKTGALLGEVGLAFEAFYPVEAHRDLEKLLSRQSGSSDKYWNMVSIDRRLYPLWGRALFGLKCLGISPHKEARSDGEWDVRIQFNWLYRRSGSPDRLIYLENDANGMKEMAEMQIKHEDDGAPAPKNSNIPIISGHTVILSMPEDDAIKCKMMLDVQWNLLCIAALSGGAEHPELLPKPETFFAMFMT
ncbi:hypothetical protein FPOAC2_03720 [Fusarium poae]|uniref:hypothetical protein n=1 Tax=Fusarium poae TaxID=36050 RepID=UPI001CE93AEB|nr:hypothetical protein FPOAC1_003609 [Fusarium poae]KAG8677585.1 hypothetical protein FPOAC1_003609 [Fusarium poae]